MDKVLAQSKALDVETREKEMRTAADEELMSEGQGTYMKHDAEVNRSDEREPSQNNTHRVEYTQSRNEPIMCNLTIRR